MNKYIFLNIVLLNWKWIVNFGYKILLKTAKCKILCFVKQFENRSCVKSIGQKLNKTINWSRQFLLADLSRASHVKSYFWIKQCSTVRDGGKTRWKKSPHRFPRALSLSLSFSLAGNPLFFVSLVSSRQWFYFYKVANIQIKWNPFGSAFAG